jgi:phosphoribosylformylglycinamidine cyclo-ligase
MFTGFEIKPGDALVGLQEEGFRSNGLSLARQILRQNFGEEWHTKSVNGKKLGELALKPSRIYTRAIVDMIGGVEGKPQAKVHGVAHITGGGIPGKLGRILKPRKLGAQIDSPFPPGDIVSFCQALGNVSDREAYRAWNMGQGMIVVTPEPEPVIRIARDHGIKAKISGRVTQTPGITIVSQGAFKKDKVLKFS